VPWWTSPSPTRNGRSATPFGEYAGQAPFTVALVDLDEGVRMMTRIVGEGRPQIGDRVRLSITEAGASGW
jgi:uncharacterized protein